MTGYLPVPGTWGEQRGAAVQWFAPTSPLSSFLDARGLTNLNAKADRPFYWSTDLDVFADNHYAWQGAGEALLAFLVPPFDPTHRAIPARETVIVSHSHGLQVVLYAAAAGLKIDRFLDIAGPVRQDMLAIAKLARPNIHRWLHVHSDWHDYMQILGELLAGNWPVRQHPLADQNVGVPKVGHSGLLYDAEYFPLWQSDGLLDFLRDAPVPLRAA